MFNLHKKLLGEVPFTYNGGKSASVAPITEEETNYRKTPSEMAALKDTWRAGWDAEAAQQAQEDLLDEKTEREEDAREELATRRGSKQVLSNAQIGFMQKAGN